HVIHILRTGVRAPNWVATQHASIDAALDRWLVVGNPLTDQHPVVGFELHLFSFCPATIDFLDFFLFFWVGFWRRRVCHTELDAVQLGTLSRPHDAAGIVGIADADRRPQSKSKQAQWFSSSWSRCSKTRSSRSCNRR